MEVKLCFGSECANAEENQNGRGSFALDQAKRRSGGQEEEARQEGRNSKNGYRQSKNQSVHPSVLKIRNSNFFHFRTFMGMRVLEATTTWTTSCDIGRGLALVRLFLDEDRRGGDPQSEHEVISMQNNMCREQAKGQRVWLFLNRYLFVNFPSPRIKVEAHGFLTIRCHLLNARSFWERERKSRLEKLCFGVGVL
jgi:hypothetical protein